MLVGVKYYYKQKFILFFFLELCYQIFKRIHTDVFKSNQTWHVTYYLLHSLWNYTDKTTGMSIVCINSMRKCFCLVSFFFIHRR